MALLSSDQNESFTRNAWHGGILRVSPKGARSLPRALFGSSQFRLIVWTSSTRSQKRKSNKSTGTVTAVWNETFEIDVADPDVEFLFCELVTVSVMGGKSVVGRIKVACKEITSTETENWFQIYGDDGEGVGEINLVISLLPKTRYIPAPSPAPAHLQSQPLVMPMQSQQYNQTSISYAPIPAPTSEQPPPYDACMQSQQYGNTAVPAPAPSDSLLVTLIQPQHAPIPNADPASSAPSITVPAPSPASAPALAPAPMPTIAAPMQLRRGVWGCSVCIVCVANVLCAAMCSSGRSGPQLCCW